MAQTGELIGRRVCGISRFVSGVEGNLFGSEEIGQEVEGSIAAVDCSAEEVEKIEELWNRQLSAARRR